MMNNFRIIPSLLFKGKRLVKGKKFKNHIDCGNPIKTCVAYESQLADELILIDLEAYQNKVEPDYKILEDIVGECNTPITFGGNISTLNSAKKSIQAGADKILLNTNLNEKLVNKISEKFGNQSIVGAIDLEFQNEKFFQIYHDKKIEINLFDKLKELLNYNIGELKVTFVNLEGSKDDFYFSLATKIVEMSNKPIIFEGGFSTLKDIEEAFKNNINSIALGTMITFSDNNIFKIKQYLENLGYNMRLRD